MDILNFEDIQLVRKQTVLLQDINWQIAKNQHWALLGLNGAGKTLLLQLIIGMIWPTSGKRQVLRKNICARPSAQNWLDKCDLAREDSCSGALRNGRSIGKIC